MKKQIFLFLASLCIFTPFRPCKAASIDLSEMLYALKEEGLLNDLPMFLSEFKLNDPHFDINKPGLFGDLPINFIIHLEINEEQKAAAISALIAQGADVNKADEIMYVTDDNKEIIIMTTPLMHALEQNNLKIIELLLEHGADPLKSTESGNTPLFSCIMDEHTDALKIILTKNPELFFAASCYALQARKFDTMIFIESIGHYFDPAPFNCGKPVMESYSAYQAYKATKQ